MVMQRLVHLIKADNRPFRIWRQETSANVGRSLRRWNEVSASGYKSLAAQEGQRTLSRGGSVEAIGFLPYDVFCVETGYGTTPEEAAFLLVAGYFPSSDLIVGNLVIGELKSVERVTSAHKKQVLTYLRLTGLKLGYQLDFGEALMRDGITRIIHGTLVPDPPRLGASVREVVVDQV